MPGFLSSLASRSFGRAPLILLLPLLLPVLALVGFEAATWDHISPRVVAIGIPVGGLTRQQAQDKLQARADSLLDRPIHITAADQQWDRSARDLGLSLPVNDILEASFRVGRTGNPLEGVFQEKDLGLANSVETAALDAAVRQMAAAVDRPMIDAVVSLDGQGGVHTTAAQSGRAVDISASAEKLSRAMLSGASSVELSVQETQPNVTDAMAAPARAQAERMLGGPGEPPLVLTFQDQRVPLTKADILPLLAIQPASDGSRLEVRIDDTAADSLARLLAAEIHQDTVDARFDWNGGNLKVIRPSANGRDVDVDTTHGLLAAALLKGDRTLALPVTATPAAVPSADPKALGIRELIDRGSTSFAGSIPEKAFNIKLAAERINGTVVPPGGTFSFNKEIGPTTLESGFQWGFAIEGGASGPKTVPSVAGGICQVATTLFQPVFWSGYALEERSSHAYWIPAYTSRGVVGLDVTVDPDTNLDFKWTNPSNDYVLVQAGVQGENVEFALYGKKPDWKVQVDPAKVSNPRPSDPTPVQQQEPSMPLGRSLVVETARDGFDVEVTRTVIPSIGDPRTLQLHTSYEPSRSVTLIGSGQGRPS